MTHSFFHTYIQTFSPPHPREVARQ
jgi:hypothetical protein